MAANDSSSLSLNWSSSLTLAPSSRTPRFLTGDKILLPAKALEELLAASASRPSQNSASHDPFQSYAENAQQEASQQLPHPLTFRLVNPSNQRVVFAGIREFSADEGEVVLSKELREALGVEEEWDEDKQARVALSNGDGEPDGKNSSSQQHITVVAKQLPKGTYVKLRPMDAGYDTEDWKSLLERHLRNNRTTLTQAEILSVPSPDPTAGSEPFRLLVDEFKPGGPGICIVDTDLEVDIEALNEEQARETLRRIAARTQKVVDSEGSSAGGILNIYNDPVQGRVVAGDYVDFELPSWYRKSPIEFELNSSDTHARLDMFVSPFARRQRVRPREDQYVWAALEGKYPRTISISPTNADLEDAEAIWVSVRSYKSPDGQAPDSPTPFSVLARIPDPEPQNSTSHTKHSEENPPNIGDVQCPNCHQWVPSRTLVLHSNFCQRNNVLCPQGCGLVFRRNSPELHSHWHCPHDTSHGTGTLSQSKHNAHFHGARACPCGRSFPSLAALAAHRTSSCPLKLILCQFCHLQVPQEGDPDNPPSPTAILHNLTPHEHAESGRTTECPVCGKPVRLRDLRSHATSHELANRDRPVPRPCRNALCPNTLDGTGMGGNTRVGTGGERNNEVGLCERCFGPLYVQTHDADERKALRRRVERRYLGQVMKGCGRSWCRNRLCREGRKNTGLEDLGPGMKEALALVKPELQAVEVGGEAVPFWFCVDEMSSRRIVVVERLVNEGIHDAEWCVGAVEAAGGEEKRAREWLGKWAPKRKGFKDGIGEW